MDELFAVSIVGQDLVRLAKSDYECRFAKGTQFKLAHLQKRPELNGRACVVVRRDKFSSDRDTLAKLRIACNVDGLENPVRVSRANLIIAKDYKPKSFCGTRIPRDELARRLKLLKYTCLDPNGNLGLSLPENRRLKDTEFTGRSYRLDQLLHYMANDNPQPFSCWNIDLGGTAKQSDVLMNSLRLACHGDNRYVLHFEFSVLFVF